MRCSALKIGVPAVLIAYAMTIGATWEMISSLERLALNTVIGVVIVTGWALHKFARCSRFSPTLLDPVLPLWALALIISTVAHWRDMWVWVGLALTLTYYLTWVIINDRLATGFLTPDSVLDAVLLAAAPIIAVSCLMIPIPTPNDRLFGVMNNPNTLSALTLFLIPSLLHRVGQAPRHRKVVYFVYLIATVVCLLLSETRGAWMGILAALGVVVFIRYRSMFVHVGMVAAACVIGVLLFNIRGDNGRTMIYELAAQTFIASPFTGNGLFNFRWHYLPWFTLNIDLTGSNMHAHNLGLHTAVELGLPGLIALAATIVLMLRHGDRLKGGLAMWAYAACAGTIVHQMVDFPILMPGMMFTFVIVLALTVPRPPARE